VQFEALQRLKSVEVPNDDVSLISQGKIQITRFDSTTAAILGVDNLLRNLGGFSGQMRCIFQSWKQLLQKYRCHDRARSVEFL